MSREGSGVSNDNKQSSEKSQSESEEKKDTCCRRFWTHKSCHYFAIISIFIVIPVLIFVGGGLLSYFLFIYRPENFLPSFLFSVYCFFGGILLLLTEFQIRIFMSFFTFLLSYFYKAVFIIFMGTLVASAYEPVPKFQWVGYLTGGVLIAIAVFQIIVGCYNSAFVEKQQEKMNDTAERYGWEPAPQISRKDFKRNRLGPEGDHGKGGNGRDDNEEEEKEVEEKEEKEKQHQQQQQKQQPKQKQSKKQKPSSSSKISSSSTQEVQLKKKERQEEEKQKRGSGVTAAVVSMPETQQFAKRGGTVAAKAYLEGGSEREAVYEAAKDEETQHYALSAAIAVGKNEQVRDTALTNISSGFGTLYDDMLE